MAWAMRDLDLEAVLAVRGPRHSRIYRVLAGFIVERRQQAQLPAGARSQAAGSLAGRQMEIGLEVLARIGRAQWQSAACPS